MDIKRNSPNFCSYENTDNQMNTSFKQFKAGNPVAFFEEKSAITFAGLLIFNKENFIVECKNQLFMCSFDTSETKSLLSFWEFKVS